jgi:hypothetical protein
VQQSFLKHGTNARIAKHAAAMPGIQCGLNLLALPGIVLFP